MTVASPKPPPKLLFCFLLILNGLFLLQSLAGRKPTPPTLRYLRRAVLVFWFCYQLIFLTD
ncbi:hypothetical protein FDUTEX481_09659 [Tolypothrix sp. PCC 7601]|nr:hypothetical protein FDUTEX481_09659 [Tolypothrix sp. PCC 7601]